MAHSTEKTRSKMDKNARGVRKLKLKGGRSKPAPKEVLFDDDARREFLTGFSKRKQEKKEAARLRVAAREKEEAKLLRQQLRDTRKKQAEENVKAATEFYGGAPMLDPKELMKVIEGEGPEDAQEQEYSNDEVVSHVIIEEFRPSDDEEDEVDPRSIKHKVSRKHQDDDDEEEFNEEPEQEDDGFGKADNAWDDWREGKVGGDGLTNEDRNVNLFGILPSSKPSSSIPKRTVRPQDEFLSVGNPAPEKQPAKKFTYETKAARRSSTQKQKARRNEKASIGRSNKPGKPSKKSGKK